MELTYKFEQLDNSKGNEVGGKNASLVEMFKELTSKGINIPDGFATSAEAYWKFIRENDIEEKLKEELSSLNSDDTEKLKKSGENCYKLVMKSKIPEEIKDAILNEYNALKRREESLTSLAVRSSATAEDLPEAILPVNMNLISI